MRTGKIARSAVTAFMNRPRRDLERWKRFSDEELVRQLDKLPADPPIYDRLRWEQKLCFLIGAYYRYAAFFADTGTGKTLISIALARYFRRLGKVGRLLVLVPNKVNKREWLDERNKHSPKTSILVLSGSSKDKWQQLDDDEDYSLLVVETYAGFARMACELEDHKKKANKQVLRPNPKKVDKLCRMFDGLILDESNFAKSHTSLAYRICRQIRKTAYCCFALSATPFGKDPSDLWAQLYLVDEGETLGTTLGMFRAAFCNEVKAEGGYAVEYHFRKAMRGTLNRMLAHSAIEFQADESTLPQLIPIRKHVALPKDAETLYQEARRALIAAKGNFTDQKNAFLRMRQISSGFLGYYDDEEGRRAQFEFAENPKRDLLLSILQSLPADRQAIVFCEFVFSGQAIQRELEKLGFLSEHLFGGCKDQEGAVARFKSGETQVLVLNNKAGGYGLNLQAASYGIYFESPVSSILRKQTRRRFERQGSSYSKVFQYDLIVDGTVDENILEWHAQNGDLFDAIIRGRARL